ncbi:Hpt domain-containing protein [Pseudodesulfovibrio sp.]|uniref:Hpt domain-containing protein n=1 Tax=Pseudodesulfovibrio sp. TaxID=2035812 RepID=UPI00262E3284|nr:Hpt domain-containing protein [Pseudodesulfovibrio sp.]MDD3311289.1 Hpt domain-containing protein [Pseudodesulfovibrio sp.]
MTLSIFNSQAFLHSLADDRELGLELLAAFMEDSPERYEQLGRALAEGDGATASSRAHSLKGMCGVVRAEPLVELALGMEHSAREGNLSLARDQYGRFTDLLAAAHAEIREFMNQD